VSLWLVSTATNGHCVSGVSRARNHTTTPGFSRGWDEELRDRRIFLVTSRWLALSLDVQDFSHLLDREIEASPVYLKIKSNND